MKASAETNKLVATRRGGRPSRQEAQKIEGQILDVARDLFFSLGYGATSIEQIAKQTGISKRTFYDRFDNKPAVFRAVVHRLIETLRPPDTGKLFEGRSLEEILLQLAQAVLHASLAPQTLALHRIILAEATRFPELALVMNEQGARREAVKLIAALLERELPNKNAQTFNASFAAEQFLQMVVSLPQRRALGLGKPMSQNELKGWAQSTVRLFLDGCRG